MYGQLPKFARHLVLAAQADLPEVTLVGGTGLALVLLTHPFASMADSASCFTSALSGALSARAAPPRPTM
jgi:hypothetical protein